MPDPLDVTPLPLHHRVLNAIVISPNQNGGVPALVSEVLNGFGQLIELPACPPNPQHEQTLPSTWSPGWERNQVEEVP